MPLQFDSVNSYIRSYTSKDYASSDPEDAVRIDCSLGVNSDLLGNCIFDTLHKFQQRSVLYEDNRTKVINEGKYYEIKYYPHDESLKESLANWYINHGVGIDELSKDNFILGNGSYDILCSLNALCLGCGRKVLGHAPQFTAYIDNVYCTGSDYEYVKFGKNTGFKFEAETYTEKMTVDHSLFIIENPNNPTGQLIPLKDIEKVAAKALELNRILIVDEAYAEYLPYNATAVNLIEKYPNIIVTRSFSKGWGMAGLRLGYAVMSTKSDTLEHLKKIELSFNSNALSRLLAQSALDSRLEHPQDPFSVREVTRNKEEFLSALDKFNHKYKKNLRCANTCKSTPIMMLYSETEDESFDLRNYLLKYGLLTVSCSTYIGLDRRAIRLMLPETEQMPLLIEILEECIQHLPEEAPGGTSDKYKQI